MSAITEKQQEAKFHIDFIREAARFQYDQCKSYLQLAAGRNDQLALCDEMDLWASVLTLLKERDQLITFIKNDRLDLAQEYLQNLKT